jgi:hypothetical protein
LVNRLSRNGLLLALPVLLLARSAAAQAPQQERIALHPCVITGGKKADTSEIEAVCTIAAIRPTMDLVPSGEVLKFFEDEACASAKDRAACVAKLNAPKGPRAKDTKGSCAKAKNRDACLGRLATATKATRTLYITLNPYTPKVTRITGLVVDTSGKRVEERSMELPRLASQSPGDAARYAVGQLLDKLEVAKAPLPELLPPSLNPTDEPQPLFVEKTPAAPATPPPAATPTPAPVPVVTKAPEPPPGRTWKTPAGITGMALGAIGLGVGGYFVTSSNKDAKAFNEAFANGLPAQSETARLAKLHDDAESKRSTAVISAGAGAALAVGGAILFLIDRPSGSTPPEEKAGTARILAGPGQVGVLVVLP